MTDEVFLEELLGCLLYTSLNGDWRFLYLEAPEFSPAGFEEPGSGAGWDTIDVPSVWQMRGYDQMCIRDRFNTP